jgi:hypothetical protein
VNGGSSVTIFLVIEIKGHTVCQQKVFQWSIMRDKLSIAPQSDILAPKLDSPCSPILAGHGVFANSQQKIKSCRDEVTCCGS